MNNVKRAMVNMKEQGMHQLHVVASKNGAFKADVLSAPLELPSRFRARTHRPELAVLEWRNRAVRLAGRR